eukprot:6492116-Amphidinium_carterae.2
MQVCRGCKTPYNSDLLGTASAFCAECKRALDRLKTLAEGRGPETVSWLSRVRESPDDVQALLQSYYAKAGRPVPGQRARKGASEKFDILEYQESMKCSSGTMVEELGCMMWRRHFLKHAESVQGGLQSPEAAEAAWLQMELEVKTNPTTTDLVWDSKGPVASPLRIWIKEADVIRHQYSMQLEKSATVKDKAVRKASAETVEKARSRTALNHDTFGGSRTLDFKEAAGSLMQSGSMAGGLANVKHIQELLPLEEWPTHSSGQATGSAASASASSCLEEQPSPSMHPEAEKHGEEKQKPAKFFQKDVACSTARCSMALTLTSGKTEVEEALKLLERKVSELQLESQEVQEHCKPVLQILLNRKECLDSILSDDTGRVTAYIASFAATMGGEEKQMSPPCRAYASLLSASAVHEKLARFDKCNERAEVDELSKEIRTDRAVHAACIAAAKTIGAELQKAIKNYSEATKKRKAVVEPVELKRQRKAASVATDPVQELSPQHCEDILRVSTLVGQKIDFMKPFVVSKEFVFASETYKDLVGPSVIAKSTEAAASESANIDAKDGAEPAAETEEAKSWSKFRERLEGDFRTFMHNGTTRLALPIEERLHVFIMSSSEKQTR